MYGTVETWHSDHSAQGDTGGSVSIAATQRDVTPSKRAHHGRGHSPNCPGHAPLTFPTTKDTSPKRTRDEMEQFSSLTCPQTTECCCVEGSDTRACLGKSGA